MPPTRSILHVLLPILLVAGASQAHAAPTPRPHPRTEAKRAPSTSTTPARLTQSTPHLTWGGGPIMPNVKVFVILWGPNVDPDVVAMLPTYFSTITQSPWIDVLAEYATASQQIGRGSFGMMVTDPDPPAGTIISETELQNEITKGISQLGLPPADDNSIYFVMFPPGVSDAFLGDCTAYCAYHSYFTVAQQDIIYAPIPECAERCDSDTAFNNLGDAMSHELAEAITDPEAGNGWYDATQVASTTEGEIGDICDYLLISPIGFTLGQPVTYLWSNDANACVVITPPDNDFSMTAAPARVSLALGATATVPITTTVTKGASEPLQLTVSAISNGLTATVSPTTINSGDSATLTVTAAADADQARVIVDTTATNGNYSHDAPVTVTVGTPGDFTLAVTPKTQNVVVGQAVTYTVSVGVFAQPIGDVNLAAFGLPLDTHATFDPPVVTPGGTSTMTFTAGTGVTAGNATFEVQGSAGGTLHLASVAAVVEVPDAAIIDVGSHPDARIASIGQNNGAAGSCALADQGPGRSTSGVLVIGVFVGIALLSRRRAR